MQKQGQKKLGVVNVYFTIISNQSHTTLVLSVWSWLHISARNANPHKVFYEL